MSAYTSMPRLRNLVLIVIAFWVGTATAIYYALGSWGERGQFGDLFGAVNALFSGLAFAGVFWALRLQSEQLELQRTELGLQREELAATRVELEGQRLQLKEQSETFALQRFEESFFALLRFHSEILSAMDLVSDEGKVTKSRDCFYVWYRRLKKQHSQHAVYTDGQTLQTVQDVYERFYKEHQAEVGHYFRNLYHIFKLVDQSSVDDKKKYTSLARAQLSGYEHLMLFYNCLSGNGYAKFKPLVEKYALLENMPQTLLIDPGRHMPLYDSPAYGEDGAN